MRRPFLLTPQLLFVADWCRLPAAPAPDHDRQRRPPVPAPPASRRHRGHARRRGHVRQRGHDRRRRHVGQRGNHRQRADQPRRGGVAGTTSGAATGGSSSAAANDRCRRFDVRRRGHHGQRRAHGRTARWRHSNDRRSHPAHPVVDRQHVPPPPRASLFATKPTRRVAAHTAIQTVVTQLQSQVRFGTRPSGPTDRRRFVRRGYRGHAHHNVMPARHQPRSR
jgi:hypothetical protein